MKVAIIGHLKHPISRPYAGGLEMFTHAFTQRLVQRGHDVTLFAATESDANLPLVPVCPATVNASIEKFGYANSSWIERTEDRVYSDLMTRLSSQNFDIVHNHSISPIPLVNADRLSNANRSPTEMVTTLHVPVLPRMREAVQRKGPSACGTFVNISRSNAKRWSSLLREQTVIHNGVDTAFWKGCNQEKTGRAVWFGRILPDKGTHYAIHAAHAAGVAIDIAGPISDQDYFDHQVQPLLTGQDRFLGHQTHEELCGLISSASVAVVTPCWDEPFGLVVAEALACGTPVAGFARGALPEIVNSDVGRLVKAQSVKQLAAAITHCKSLSSQRCRAVANQHFSLDAMMDQYEDYYDGVVAERQRKPVVAAARPRLRTEKLLPQAPTLLPAIGGV